MATSTAYVPRLKARYDSELAAQLKKDLGLENVHEVPHLEKIVINSGLGKAKDDKRVIETAGNTIAKITGQQPVETIARKSIAGFKLREGNKIGLKVTLRGERMYEFLDRLITVVLPRMRDFHGVSPKAFDGHGNYSLGFREQSVFPELSYEDTTTPHGLQVNIITSTDSNEHAYALLQAFGMPFEKESK